MNHVFWASPELTLTWAAYRWFAPLGMVGFSVIRVWTALIFPFEPSNFSDFAYARFKMRVCAAAEFRNCYRLNLFVDGLLLQRRAWIHSLFNCLQIKDCTRDTAVAHFRDQTLWWYFIKLNDPFPLIFTYLNSIVAKIEITSFNSRYLKA